jgi:hypothetical protein
LDRRLGGPQGRSGQCEQKNVFAPARYRTPSTQPAVHRYNDLAIPISVIKVSKVKLYGSAIAEAVSRLLLTAAARVRARVWQVGFVVDEMASGQVFSEYFGFPRQNHFIPPTSPSSQSPGAGTIDQVMAAVPRGPSMDSTSH